MVGLSLRTWLVVVVVWMAASAAAQSIIASNWTASEEAEADKYTVSMAVSMGDDSVPLASVVQLVTEGNGYFGGAYSSTTGINGPVLLINSSNTIDIRPENVVVMSCDASAYPGFISALSVFGDALQANASAVVWYSEQAAFCNLAGYAGTYWKIFSMKSINDTQRMLDNINTLSEDSPSGGGVAITIGATNSDYVSSNSSGGSSSSSSGGGDPLGPSPSTAVAMIILYSITGLITTLFLIIIFTGAIRAHRHPERYGPRNVMGRPRQSRARGLARAMLESLPIVKFGEREEPKATDIELADASAREVSTETSADGAEHAPGAVEILPTEHAKADGRTQAPAEGGIAAAVKDDSAASPPAESETQGCSICTEDFEIGQDQRVLPCDHRFHPACIDPWLLNVSGTCPLCRIDLHPQNSEMPGQDENGNIIRDENGEGMAPPLAMDGDSRRMSVRRSIMLGLMGIGRPDRLTREERVLALRAARGQQAVQRRREQEEGVAATPEEESRVRTRLRNAFRIRTRHTGQEDVQQASAGVGEAAGQQQREPGE